MKTRIRECTEKEKLFFGELRHIQHLINKVYPKGIVSIVSDTWDFWQVITEYASILKSDILSREGKVVFRPDSGNPVDIICGDTNAKMESPEYKGAVECLWEIFGGTINKAGYKELDIHIGLIYGDSITLERAESILSKLAEKGFASNNIVFGIGSYTYQYNTRDTFGFAIKSTYGIVNGEGREIFKDPATDSGVKKSAKGLLKVIGENGNYQLIDGLSQIDNDDDSMKLVFKDGKLLIEQGLAEIRGKI